MFKWTYSQGLVICLAACGLASLISPSFGQEYRIAVMPFKDVALYGERSQFVQNLPEMLMGNLATSQRVKVVERSQIDKALLNFQLETNALFEESSAIRVGRWVGATHVVLGSLTTLGEKVRIDVRMVSLGSGDVTTTAKVEGIKSDLFDMVNTVSTKLLASFTGEAIQFRERPKTLHDKTYVIRPSADVAPNPSTLSISSMLHQNVDPNFTISSETHYAVGSAERETGNSYWPKQIVNAYYPWRVDLKVDDKVVATFHPVDQGASPENQKVMTIGSESCKVTVRPLEVRLGWSEKDAFGRPAIRTIELVRVNLLIERSQ